MSDSFHRLREQIFGNLELSFLSLHRLFCLFLPWLRKLGAGVQLRHLGEFGSSLLLFGLTDRSLLHRVRGVILEAATVYAITAFNRINDTFLLQLRTVFILDDHCRAYHLEPKNNCQQCKP